MIPGAFNGLTLLGVLLGCAAIIAAAILDGPTRLDRAVARIRGWLR